MISNSAPQPCQKKGHAQSCILDGLVSPLDHLQLDSIRPYMSDAYKHSSEENTMAFRVLQLIPFQDKGSALPITQPGVYGNQATARTVSWIVFLLHKTGQRICIHMLWEAVLCCLVQTANLGDGVTRAEQGMSSSLSPWILRASIEIFYICLNQCQLTGKILLTFTAEIGSCACCQATCHYLQYANSSYRKKCF